MTEGQKISEIYHSLFLYSLSKAEIKRWEAGKKLKLQKKHSEKQFKAKTIDCTKKRASAESVALLLNKIPTVLFVGITGSLAMNNAGPDSDIDIMIITTKNTTWLTRLLVLLILKLKGMPLRKANDKNEKDKLCFNLWIDESALAWPFTKNAYIAHEIAQVVPLLNKSSAYEKWILKNEWIFEYWPKAISRPTAVQEVPHDMSQWNIVLCFLNVIFFSIQKWYMAGKRTREYVSFHEAYFHPYDWGEKITKELARAGVWERVE